MEPQSSFQPQASIDSSIFLVSAADLGLSSPKALAKFMEQPVSFSILPAKFLYEYVATAPNAWADAILATRNPEIISSARKALHDCLVHHDAAFATFREVKTVCASTSLTLGWLYIASSTSRRSSEKGFIRNFGIVVFGLMAIVAKKAVDSRQSGRRAGLEACLNRIL